jgi:hypothetical protein
VDGQVVLRAFDRRAARGVVVYELEHVAAHGVRKVLSRRRVRVPITSPLGSYAGPDVRFGLAAAQRLGAEFVDRSHFDHAPAR